MRAVRDRTSAAMACNACARLLAGGTAAVLPAADTGGKAAGVGRRAGNGRKNGFMGMATL